MATRRTDSEHVTRNLQLDPGETILAEANRQDGTRIVVTSAGRKIVVTNDGINVVVGPQYIHDAPKVEIPTFDASHPPVVHHGGEDADA